MLVASRLEAAPFQFSIVQADVLFSSHERESNLAEDNRPTYAILVQV